MLLLIVSVHVKGSDHMRYVVARVITSPAGAVKTARLLVTDVPSGTQLGDVLAALEAAGLGGEFSEAGVPFGNHEVKPDSRGWPWGIHAIDEAAAVKWTSWHDRRPEPGSVTWEMLTRTRGRNEGRRVTLRLTDAEHATYSLAAQRAGQSLQEWMVAAADAAAVAEAQVRSGSVSARTARRQAVAEAADSKAAS
jgi:hypothetical protein